MARLWRKGIKKRKKKKTFKGDWHYQLAAKHAWVKSKIGLVQGKQYSEGKENLALAKQSRSWALCLR